MGKHAMVKKLSTHKFCDLRTSLTMPFADPNKRIQKVKTWKKNNPEKVKAHRKRWRKRRAKKKTNDLKILIEIVENCTTEANMKNRHGETEKKGSQERKPGKMTKKEMKKVTKNKRKRIEKEQNGGMVS